MKSVVLVSALVLFFAILSGIAAAQEKGPRGSGSEVCVNASDQAEARRLFPGATIHVIRDSPDPLMNGWRIVSGRATLMTDAEEIQLRLHEKARAIQLGNE